ncbi:hypothetical protein GCM10008938_14530 [Deinococcus roseus]|uniref:Uncharacterized protein n=1 Tax=Deinococcus roseus TaxID=392414 RepID=A0ABQ2CX57_9DEIO|nr:hypothetical protein GCM10008938_14530 [Deinococcus roseus]
MSKFFAQAVLWLKKTTFIRIDFSLRLDNLRPRPEMPGISEVHNIHASMLLRKLR